MTDFRLIITGSRDWTDTAAIRDALDYAMCYIQERRLVVVHGACPTGADRHADQLARQMRARGMPVDIEPHPAVGHPTEDFGPWPGAGPRRNAHMIALGADACYAFIRPCAKRRCRHPGPHGSHGATGCADRAEAAGILVRRWTA
ncbi:SLOG family protein [Streptomyces aidingensis]|uniref:YspA cpYpsA-related SLOG domain-containing protein n=1 Tax=Streptomyces aidingensis TaxID=910347 RepID=A0A1I1PUI7_9ACTN|nr:SLOG family protein [Streptomyces aidingensis]SFD13519.1 Protein of unknown function [Streptomyces aidingensis]